MRDVHTSHSPHDRLTFMANDMSEVLSRPGNGDVKAIIMLDDGEHGAVMTYGYGETKEVLAEMYSHFAAVANSMGVNVDFVGVPNSPGEMEA